MKIKKIPKSELSDRMNRFTFEMNKAYPNWEVCMIIGSVSMYYLTGTICDGVLVITRGEKPVLWVRKSYERAILESDFGDIRPMPGFRDLADDLEKSATPADILFLDMSAATLDWYEIFCKYIKFNKVLPIDKVMLKTRAVKSRYEIELMSGAGKTVERLLNEEVPKLFRTGMSEAELGGELFSLFIKNNYHGVSRFSMRNTDVVLGHIGFAESPLFPSIFNGASGLTGLCAAVPVLGSRDVLLKEGDLIYLDFGFGIEGYNVDKTLIYSYKKTQSETVINAHNHCLELEKKAASMLVEGAVPSKIYNTVYELVKPELRSCFMGTEKRRVPFLGHGVGLYVDEYPVIAKNFDEPIKCGMTIAVEPKMGINGAGMVGSENTYLVTETDAVCLTGTTHELVIVE